MHIAVTPAGAPEPPEEPPEPEEPEEPDEDPPEPPDDECTADAGRTVTVAVAVAVAVRVTVGVALGEAVTVTVTVGTATGDALVTGRAEAAVLASAPPSSEPDEPMPTPRENSTTAPIHTFLRLRNGRVSGGAGTGAGGWNDMETLKVCRTDERIRSIAASWR